MNWEYYKAISFVIFPFFCKFEFLDSLLISIFLTLNTHAIISKSVISTLSEKIYYDNSKRFLHVFAHKQYNI